MFCSEDYLALKAIFSVFVLHPQIPDFQIVVSRPNVVRSYNGKVIYSALMMYKSQFWKIDPYDGFVVRVTYSTHTQTHTNVCVCVCVCVCMCVCVRARACVCVCHNSKKQSRNYYSLETFILLFFFLIRTLPFTLTFPNCHIINYLLLNIKSATCTNLYCRFYEDFYLMKLYTVCKPVFCLREDKQKSKGLPIKTKQ